jgi:uncharacterized protein
MAKDEPATETRFAVTRRNRVARRPKRGIYDKKAVYEILDSAIVCHLAYVIEDQPYCTPNGFWREGDHVYWHGSAASRMIKAQAEGIPVCLTVTHLDALNLARCGFNHAVNYRCAMVFGQAVKVENDAKLQLMDRFIDRFYPGRSRLLRPATNKEIKATTILGMPIDQASAKIRDVDFGDNEEDYAVPAWTALIPIKMVMGDMVECPRQLPGVKRPKGMRAYRPGRKLDDVVAETYRETFGSS